MDATLFQQPASPRSQSLLSLFTTLHDDEFTSSDLDTAFDGFDFSFDPCFEAVRLAGCDDYDLFHQAGSIGDVDTFLSEPLQYDVMESYAVHKAAFPVQESVPSRNRKRQASKSEVNDLYGQIIFSADGGPVKRQRRARFSEEKKKQVNANRKRGSCLRCRLMHRECSEKDPCEPCLAIAQAKASSRRLTWMECIRPSLRDISIFYETSIKPAEISIDDIASHLLDTESYWVGLPFQLDSFSASTYFASWLANGTNHSNFYIPRFLRSKQFGEIVSWDFGDDLSVKLQLLLYLTKKLHNWDPHEAHMGYLTGQLLPVRHYLGTLILGDLEKKLRPTALERQSHRELHVLFLVLFGMSWAARYATIDMVLNGNEVTNDLISKSEAFCRLLAHYLVYIGSTIGIIDASSTETIMAKSHFRLDKPGTSFRQMRSDVTPCMSGSEIECQSTSSPYGFHCALRGASSDAFDPAGNCRRCSPWHYHRFEPSELDVLGDDSPLNEPLAQTSTRPMSHWTLYFTHKESFEIYNIRTLRAFAYKPVASSTQAASQFERSSNSRLQDQCCTACEDPMPRGED